MHPNNDDDDVMPELKWDTDTTDSSEHDQSPPETSDEEDVPVTPKCVPLKLYGDGTPVTETRQVFSTGSGGQAPQEQVATPLTEEKPFKKSRKENISDVTNLSNDEVEDTSTGFRFLQLHVL